MVDNFTVNNNNELTPNAPQGEFILFQSAPLFLNCFI